MDQPPTILSPRGRRGLGDGTDVRVPGKQHEETEKGRSKGDLTGQVTAELFKSHFNCGEEPTLKAL